MFVKDTALYFLKILFVLSFCISITLTSENEMGCISSSSIDGRHDGSNIDSLNVWYFSPVKTVGPGVLRGVLKL